MRQWRSRFLSGLALVVALAAVLTVPLAASGCRADDAATDADLEQEIDRFLASYGLAVTGEPLRFEITVPGSWAVQLGDYPEGLFWGLVDVYSRDVGYGLAALKSQKVEVWRYGLFGGLPGQGEQSQFTYPSSLVIVARQHKLAGAWLEFCENTIGPSVRKRYLGEIAGLTFEEWVESKGYFADPSENGDLKDMQPQEVVEAFFEATGAGNKTRAYACLTPTAMLSILTANLDPNTLYNPGFSPDNSLVENILRARVLAIEMRDPSAPGGELTAIGGRTEIEMAVELEIATREAAFGPGQRLTTWFTVAHKTSLGWKLSGFGTGP